MTAVLSTFGSTHHLLKITGGLFVYKLTDTLHRFVQNTHKFQFNFNEFQVTNFQIRNFCSTLMDLFTSLSISYYATRKMAIINV